MIPRYDIEVDSTLPIDATFWVPTREEVDEGIGFFHNTWSIDTDLKEAALVAQAEQVAINFVDERTSTAEEFDAVASAIEFESPDDPTEDAPALVWQPDWYGLEGLELGVAGLTYALSAVGVIPAASCRAHAAAHRQWAEYPVVSMAIGDEHATILQRLAHAAGCGFEIDENRPQLLAVYAPSIVEMAALAQLALDSVTEFYGDVANRTEPKDGRS
ncbi:hypothetical protein ACQUSY_02770 [Microbacterium sp. YY-03]|uniref:hypothetical protein n=1 Tax=Microbacterium sp. YY-03 TaxID=3421636 RepID=UPI003D17493A